MNGREKVLAAFEQGTPEIPVGICFDGVFYRDHWDALTDLPWWIYYDADIEKQLQFRIPIVQKMGVDWYQIFPCASKSERSAIVTEPERDPLWAVQTNRLTGKSKRIKRPAAGGDTLLESEPDIDIEDIAQVMDLLPAQQNFDAGEYIASGHADMAQRMTTALGSTAAAVRYVNEPFGRCVRTLGFENFMMLAAINPTGLAKVLMTYFERVTHFLICEAAALGADFIFCTETFSEMISSDTYRLANLPVLRTMAETAHSFGLRMVLYYCGNPNGKLEAILDSGIDAIALEDGKKNFVNDISEIVQAVRGRCAVFGNVNPYTVLEVGSQQDLSCEINRQLTAARAANGRFLMSVGSPITPDTSFSRVKDFIDMTKSLGVL